MKMARGKSLELTALGGGAVIAGALPGCASAGVGRREQAMTGGLSAARLDRMEEVFILLSRQPWDWENQPAAADAGGAKNSSAAANAAADTKASSAAANRKTSAGSPRSSGEKAATPIPAKPGQP